MAQHFREACTCPACFGYLETPMRLECGYICCQRCLDSLWKEPLGEGLLCPQCSVVSEKDNIKHHFQLDRIVSKVKALEPQLRATLQLNPRIKKFQAAGKQKPALTCPSHKTTQKVDVTLDVDTAHSHLVISGDLRSVRYGHYAQREGSRAESFDVATCVLGAPRLASGRSYWEVHVGASREWDVGVCADAASRRGPLRLSTELGFWAVGLRLGQVFTACTVPLTELQLPPRLRRLGILLDADLGLLTFCDVADGAHIFTFTRVAARPLRPFFAPASTLPDDPGVLRICPVGRVAQDPSLPASLPASLRPSRRSFPQSSLPASPPASPQSSHQSSPPILPAAIRRSSPRSTPPAFPAFL